LTFRRAGAFNWGLIRFQDRRQPMTRAETRKPATTTTPAAKGGATR
jgi:hypothetical protein